MITFILYYKLTNLLSNYRFNPNAHVQRCFYFRHATPRHATPRHATPLHSTPCPAPPHHTPHHNTRPTTTHAPPQHTPHHNTRPTTTHAPPHTATTPHHTPHHIPHATPHHTTPHHTTPHHTPSHVTPHHTSHHHTHTHHTSLLFRLFSLLSLTRILTVPLGSKMKGRVLENSSGYATHDSIVFHNFNRVFVVRICWFFFTTQFFTKSSNPNIFVHMKASYISVKLKFLSTVD